MRGTRSYVAWVATRTGRLFFLRSECESRALLCGPRGTPTVAAPRLRANSTYKQLSPSIHSRTNANPPSSSTRLLPICGISPKLPGTLGRAAMRK